VDLVGRCGLECRQANRVGKMPRLERGTETQGDSPVPAPGRGP
jgi:hypothetical protein